MENDDPLYVGLMSGTSVDSIDSALVRCGNAGVEILATHSHPFPPGIKAQVSDISHSGSGEIERMGVLDRELGLIFAQATLELLAQSGTRTEQVRAIGSHGQTIRHRPPSATTSGSAGFTLQIGDPNTIAEVTGITTVADFRRRDIAAGGEGAPLAPAFHAQALAKPGINRAIVNIGGIANVTILAGTELQMGFDTGPGNTLLDHWIQRSLGAPFDQDGKWSSGGHVQQALLNGLLKHPFFEKTGPRSTGKEAFNLAWLDSCLATLDKIAENDVQATLVDLTSSTIASAIKSCPPEITDVYVCGGGSHNYHLLQRLSAQLAPAKVATTAALGMDPDWVEAATFAWLASRTLEGLTGNSVVVTGADGPRILGGIYWGCG